MNFSTFPLFRRSWVNVLEIFREGRLSENEHSITFRD